MILVVDLSESRLRVEAGDDLKRLSAELGSAAQLDRPLPAGVRLDEDGSHLWIEIAMLRDLAGRLRDADWQSRFDAMIAFAARHGWVDEEKRAVRVHFGASPKP